MASKLCLHASRLVAAQSRPCVWQSAHEQACFGTYTAHTSVRPFIHRVQPHPVECLSLHTSNGLQLDVSSCSLLALMLLLQCRHRERSRSAMVTRRPPTWSSLVTMALSLQRRSASLLRKLSWAWWLVALPRPPPAAAPPVGRAQSSGMAAETSCTAGTRSRRPRPFHLPQPQRPAHHHPVSSLRQRSATTLASRPERPSCEWRFSTPTATVSQDGRVACACTYVQHAAKAQFGDKLRPHQGLSRPLCLCWLAACGLHRSFSSKYVDS